MALRDTWHRTLVYFGLAEEDDGYRDEIETEPEEEVNDPYRDRPNVRRLQNRRARRGENGDTLADQSPRAGGQTRVRAPGGPRGRERGPGHARPPHSVQRPHPAP